MKEKEETITKKACATELKKTTLNDYKNNIINIITAFLLYASTTLNNMTGVIITILFISYQFFKLTQNKKNIAYYKEEYDV